MVTGWAVVLKGESPETGLCYTDAPKIIGQGTLWQIYTAEHGAEKFLNVKFGDASYEIVKVEIRRAT